jgi:ABC-type phosphate transport system substrate-binding protein
MKSLSMRRLIPACMVAATAVVALAAPVSANAASDLGTQCSGANIKGEGSSFQAAILTKWAVDFNAILGVPNKNVFACGGTQGSLGTPKVEYLQGANEKGSGACIHGFGAETVSPPQYREFEYCGTDEAPNEKQKGEMEAHKTGGEAKSLETVPVLQGSVAVIVHLPEGCLASSEVEVGGIKHKLGRLVLDNSSVEGVFRGTIKTWKALVANQAGSGSDALSCKGGAAEEESKISVVVRLDHSGTTHIFKSYLEQVYTGTTPMEAYPEEIGGKKTGCGAALPESEETWKEVASECQNQRWPTAATVVRPSSSGNTGVINTVATTASSIGYGDLAQVREKLVFSASCTKHPTECGGENKKGSETKLGEQHTKFWAEVQDTAVPAVNGYADPASNGDIEKVANSNCSGTVYTNTSGEKFPPSSTRELWSAAKAELTEKKYAVCGLTYDLAWRQYKPYLGTLLEEPEGKAKATTVANFLRWAVNAKAEGGGALAKNADYEKLPSSLVEEAEDGIEEIGFETAGP